MRVEHTCASDEDLAAFVEGGLAEPRRSRVISHVVACAECSEIVAESRRALPAAALPRHLTRRLPAARVWLTATAAAAVVAAAFVGVLSLQAPRAPRAPLLTQAEIELAGALRLHAREEWRYPSSFSPAGFAASTSPRRAAFELGAVDLDRRVAAKAELHESCAASMESAALLLSRLDGGQLLARELVDGARRVRQTSNADASDGPALAGAVVALGLPREWFDRGARWERARLAARAGIRPTLELEAIASDAESAGLPGEGAAQVARELRSLAATPRWQPREWQSAERALSRLMQLP